MELLTGEAAKRKHAKGRCIVRNCSRMARVRIRNSRKYVCSMCDTCATRRYREKYPILYAYVTLRSNAKRRRKVFTITMEYFEQWCVENRYLELKGQGGEDYTIDRDDPRKGYEPGNLKLMTRAKNSRKRWADYYSANSFQHIYLEDEDEIQNKVGHHTDEEPPF